MASDIFGLRVEFTRLCFCRVSGRMRGSLATLERLTQIFPEDINLKNDLGVAHLLLGDNKGARKVYEEVCVYCMLMSYQTHTLVCDWLSDVGASPAGSGGCPQQRLRQSSLRLHPEVREQDSREYSVPEGRIITSLLIFKFFLNNLKPDAAMLCLSRRAWSRVNREQTTGVFISTWATPCRGSETTV